ncbi:MAG: DUF4956 domain-containing protein [Myxococcota bacterium]
MTDFLDQLLHYEAGPTWQAAATCMLLSFVLCQLISAVYAWTHEGLSYSRGFVSSLVMGGMVSTILLLAIGNNVARGLGLLGTLALVRFRATLKDTRDMVFVFASLSVGIAVGVQAFSVAIMGTLAYCLLAAHLAFSEWGARKRFDGLLRFQSSLQAELDSAVVRALSGHCQQFVLIALREVAQGAQVERAYQIRLKDPAHADDLLRSLRQIESLSGITLMMQDQAGEV